MDQNMPQPIPPPPGAQVPQPPAASFGTEEEGSRPLRKIVSIVIGLVVVLLIIGLTLFFIVPLFSKPSGTVTLTWWGVWEDKSAFAGVISDFERTHPKIKISYEKQDIKSLGHYIDRLTTRIQNGTGPDIYRFHNSWPIQLQGYLAPLPQSVLAATQLETQYYNTVKRDMKYGNAYYGVPLGVDTMALFVNNDLLAAAGVAPPKTWNDVLKIVPTLTVLDADGKIQTSGIALGTYDNIVHASDIISLILIQDGVDIYNIGGQTRQKAIDALGTFYAYFSKGDANGDGHVWDSSLAQSNVMFAQGNLALYFGYSWDAQDFKNRSPNLNFSVIPVPQLGNKTQTISSYWAEGVSAKSKHQKEAFEFLTYISKKESLEKMYAAQAKTRLFGELYPRRDMKNLLKSNALIMPFLDQADNAVATPFSSDTYDDAMNTALNTYLGNAIRSIVDGNTSPESAVDALGQGEAQVLGRYNVQTKK